MPSSSYSASFGRLQALSLNFLPEEYMMDLLRARDVGEIIKQLASTWYGHEIERAASLYKPLDLIEIALNRHLVGVNTTAMGSSPFNGKSAIRAYLAKWDILNIELILSSKILGKTITETEHFLVSSRKVPAGVEGGNIVHDDIMILLSQTNVEDVVNQLIRYGYGTVLMQHLEKYKKTEDLGPMMVALQRFYYSSLLEGLKFFQGDEGVIRELIKAQIDRRNILNLSKAKESSIDMKVINQHFIEGGTISTQELGEIYTAKNVDELVGRIEPYYKFGEGLEEYNKTKSLIDFEVAIDKVINERQFKRLKNVPLSIGIIFYFIIRAELERANLRKIVYGKHYNLSTERIRSMLIFG